MITILSGGTGTPKLLQGIKEVVNNEDITVIVNTAEDKWLSHGYFSPDIDTVLYTLADKIDDSYWYGIKGDTFKTHETLRKLGYNEVFKIGDMDRAVHIQRGKLIKDGLSLSEAIDIQRKALGVKARVMPMTDARVETVVKTLKKDMDFHEFWVANKGELEVLDVNYKGISKALPFNGAIGAIKKADRIIIGPSNPITSILPILSLKGMPQELKRKKNRCIAVSPIIGDRPLSGPAGKLMTAKGYGTNSVNVAKIYKGLITKFVIDNLEKDSILEQINKLEIECLKTNTIMDSLEDKIKLAKFLIKLNLN
ncbi:MAG: 2-phospho-L-lactate transferase [Candidatus Hydrothermarchaeales archaeon]